MNFETVFWFMKHSPDQMQNHYQTGKKILYKWSKITMNSYFQATGCVFKIISRPMEGIIVDTKRWALTKKSPAAASPLVLSK